MVHVLSVYKYYSKTLQLGSPAPYHLPLVLCVRTALWGRRPAVSVCVSVCDCVASCVLPLTDPSSNGDLLRRHASVGEEAADSPYSQRNVGHSTTYSSQGGKGNHTAG